MHLSTAVRSALLPLLLTLGGVGLTVAAWLGAKAQEENLIRAELERQVQERATGLGWSLSAHLAVADAIAGFFSASKKVDREEFRAYAEISRQRHVAVRAMEWAPVLDASNRATMLAEAAADGPSGFTIWQRGPEDERMPSVTQGTQVPVLYAEPEASNQPAFGFDLWSNLSRRRTLQQAHEHDATWISEPIKLVQGGRAVLACRPVFHYTHDGAARPLGPGGPVGFAVVVIEPARFPVLDAPTAGDALDLCLLDLTNPEPVLLGGPVAIAPGPGVAEVALDTGSRRWVIRGRARLDLASNIGADRAWQLLVGGLLLTLLLGGLLGMSSYRALRAASRNEELAGDLQRTVAQLEEENALRAEAEQRLLASMERLEEANADLQQFAHSTSHDLREPLRTITNFGQLLQQEYGAAFDEQGERWLAFMTAGARRMGDMIDNLLAYARVGDKGRALEAVDLSSCMEAALENLATAIEESAAAVETSALPTVSGYAPHLTLLLQNLVHNAIKFRSDASPRIQVHAERNGDAWTIHVDDNGMGIEEKHRAKVFQMFQRLSRGQGARGTGMGLGICRRIVEHHGGRMGVTDSPLGGSRFWVRLPAAPAPDA